MVSTRELPVGARLPAHAGSAGGIGPARQHLDPVGDDEGRIEADAELADELRILLLIAGQALEELGGTGLGDGAQVRDRLLAAHADAVVADRQGARLRIGVDPDRQLAVRAEQLRLRQCQEAQLVVGVRGVGDQFAQEDLPVAVQGVDHQLQQLADFCLEAQLSRARSTCFHPRSNARHGQAGGMGPNFRLSSQRARHAATVSRQQASAASRPSRPRAVGILPSECRRVVRCRRC